MKDKILFIEDDPTIQTMARSYLEMAGWKVEIAGTAAEGRAAFERVPPDAVLLDVGLPDGSGFDLCRWMRERDNDGTPIIFITAQSDKKSRMRGFNAGGFDYVVKPFSWSELTARVGLHIKLRRATRDLELERARLRHELKARRDLTEMVARSLREPLTAVRDALQKLRRGGPTAEGESAGLIDESCRTSERMLMMINDVIDTDQLEQSALKAERAPVHIGLILDELYGKFTADKHADRIAFDNETPRDLEIETDLSLVVRVLAHLVSNAFRHGGGSVGVEAARDGKSGAVRFAVCDRGPGIAFSERKRIFENSARSGTGLRFCRIAAEALGGRLWVEGREGGGSRFLLELAAPVRAPTA
ncbi:MAG: response regulator [Elusimicrobiota bacterium]